MQEAKAGMVDPTLADIIEEPEIPSERTGGVRNVFIWHGQELISEYEILNAIQYLIDIKILKIK